MVEVVAPGVPGVAAGSRVVLVLDTLGIEELQCGETVLISDVLRIALGEDELAHVLLDTGSSLGEALVITLELLLLSGEPAGAEHPEILELIVVVEDGLHRLHTSHGEACHSAMGIIGNDTIVILDEGDDAAYEILLEEGHLVHEVLGGDGAVGHHHNHGLHFTLGQEVVEDVAGATYAGP